MKNSLWINVALASVFLNTACHREEKPGAVQLQPGHMQVETSEEDHNPQALNALAAPYYKASVAKASVMNEDTVFYTQINMTPAPLINATTQQKKGAFVFVTRPSKGIVLFKVSGSAIKGDVTYQPFQNINGNDSFSFYYREPATASTPERRSNIVTVNMKINAVNDAPIIEGPKQIALRQIVDPANPGESRTFNYSIFDIDSQNLTVEATGLPYYANYDSTLQQLTINNSGAATFQGFSFQIKASDGTLTTTQSVNVGIRYEYSPVTSFYNGADKPLIASQTWDQNGSNVQEITRLQADVPTYDADKILAFNLKNRSYWGSAAYNFATTGPINLAKYRFMRFDLGWDDRTMTQRPSVRVFLFNATNGQESLAEVFTYGDGGLYSHVVDLVKMSSNGFDLTKVSGVALAVSEPGNLNYRFFMDNITLMGITPVPLDYPAPEVVINDYDNTKLKLTVKNPPAGTPTKYTWRLSRYDKTSITTLETLTPYLPFSQYAGFIGGRVSGSITIGTKIYQAKNTLEILYGPINATGRLKKVEYDIAIPVNNPNSMASYAHIMNQSREVRAKAANNASVANPLQLTPIEYKFLWDRGIIRYQFQDLTTAEQQTVGNALRTLWDTAGILFVEDSVFAPRDFDKSKVPLITIRYMKATDMDATDPTAQASLLKESTCFVSPNLGLSARVVALKNKAMGNNQCLEFSSNVSIDATGSDSYVVDTLLHEFLHVLGMAHEQVHPDSFQRDANGNPKMDAAKNYIFDRTRVNDAVINPWDLGQFKFFASVSLYKLPYDDQSIMHYSKYSSTICRETGVDPATGNVAWDYKLLDPVDEQNYNKAFQDKLDTLSSSFPNCARKLSWDDFTRYPECENACATLPLAKFQIGAFDPAPGVAPGRGLSDLDKETLRRIYKFNWMLRSQTTLDYNSSNPVLHPANVAGSLVTLTKEIVADVKAKAANPSAVLIQDDPAKPHFFVNQLLKTMNQRRVSGDCVSPETNIVDGRRSCHIPVRCIQPSTKGNLIVPVTQKLIVTERGETSCSMSFSADGSVCLSGSARGMAANGSYGNVVCALRAYEFTFSEIQ